MKRYGVKHPVHHSKFMNNAFSHKIYKWKSGHITTKLQGYEPNALQLLEDIGYTENDILTNRSDVPEIWYHISNKKHRHYPDMFIPKENKIIEIKSEYTYNVNLKINLLKQQASINAGYNYDFLILKKDN